MSKSKALVAQYRKAIAGWSAGAGATTMDMTPYARSLADGMMNATAQGPLPRPPQQFISGAFNPSLPATVTPIDEVRPDGTLIPRIRQYPVGYNLPTPPGQYKLVDFQTLRQLSRIYDIARRCIDIRRQEISQLDWTITMRDDKAEPDEAVLEQIRDFFQRPDPIRGLEWDDWIKVAVEEVLVIDALSIYPHPTWRSGAGPANGDLFALEILDGTTIKPLIDVRGTRPQPPAPAYQQFLWGIPRSEFSTDAQEVTPEFTSTELYYRPYNPMPDSMYGFSNLESVIINVNLALKRQQWWTAYYTDGTLPAGIIEAPAEWDAKELREFEEDWNSMLAGDQAWKHRVKFSPGSFQELKPPLDTGTDMTVFDKWLATVTCMGFDVTPIEIGLDPQAGLGGAGWSEQQENVLYRKSLQPLTSWFERLLDRIIEQWFHRPDICFRFQFAEIEDAVAKAQMNATLLQNAQRTPNELRTADGLDPVDDPEADQLILVTRTGPLLLSDINAASKQSVGLNPDGSEKEPPPAPTITPAFAPPPLDPNQDDEDDEDDDQSKAVLQDLRNWQRKSLKAVKDGKPASVTFKSDVIAPSVAEELRSSLEKAATADDVRQAFGDAHVRHMALDRLQEEIGVELVGR